MPDQFVVPQFLDVEAKIIGPITGRQFIILMAMAVSEFLVYKLLSNFILILLVGLPILMASIGFAFVKVNGKPLHFLFLNMIQTFRKPMIRVWDKTPTDSMLKQSLKKEEIPEVIIKTKPALSISHLEEMSLILNTGGMYQPDETDSYVKEKK